MNSSRNGLTLIEVLVALVVLALLGSALMGVLPQLSRTTRGSTIDTVQTSSLVGIFEQLGSDWSNVTAWSAELISTTVVDPHGGQEIVVAVTLVDFVATTFDDACAATIDEVEIGVRKRVVITCAGEGSLPSRQLRAEYGNPGV